MSLRSRWLLSLFGLGQALFVLRVVHRLCRTAAGERVRPTLLTGTGQRPHLAIIVPVLNERDRLAPCLEGLLKQGREVAEILVVDGGSHDGTQELVRRYSARDSRLWLLDASPIPPGWNGKSWGLHRAYERLAPTVDWILTVDADVRPGPHLASSLLEHARGRELAALSVAPRLEIAGSGQALLHPALLATLIYRFGIPGRPIRTLHEVQANGQCFLVKRAVLELCGGFACARTSVCEDVTLARTLVAAGYAVGFYEAGDLVHVEMYRTWQEAWRNWTRSLPMHDQFSGYHTVIGWLEIALVQALPLPLFLLLLYLRKCKRMPGLLWLNGLCVVLRLGVLAGSARAYRSRPWTYWLSPLCDLPVAIKLASSAWRRRHLWRGRVIIRGGIK